MLVSWSQYLLDDQIIFDRSAGLDDECESCCDFSSKQEVVIGQSLHSQVGCHRSQIVSVLNITELYQHTILYCWLDSELIEIVDPETDDAVTEHLVGEEVLETQRDELHCSWIRTHHSILWCWRWLRGYHWWYWWWWWWSGSRRSRWYLTDTITVSCVSFVRRYGVRWGQWCRVSRSNGWVNQMWYSEYDSTKTKPTWNNYDDITLRITSGDYQSNESCVTKGKRCCYLLSLT